jgi:hypothetical protein
LLGQAIEKDKNFVEAFIVAGRPIFDEAVSNATSDYEKGLS